MKYILRLLIVFQLTTVGCKEEVQFNAAPENEQNFTVSPDPILLQGPIVKIAKAPSDHKIGKSTQVIFEVIQGDSEIKEVNCLVNKKQFHVTGNLELWI